ncbi:MAG: DUF4199 domain-containing protein [Ginsengibacter sp.]
MNQTVTTTTTKGLVLSLILIVIALAVYFSGINMSSGIQYVGYLVFCIGIIYFISQYGKQINYASTFGNYFSHGFKISAIVTVIMIIYVVIFFMLFPEVKEKAMEEARKGMQSKNLSEEQMTQAIDMTRKFFMAFLIGGTLIGYLLFGVIASLIGAAVTKKDPNNFQQQTGQIS